MRKAVKPMNRDLWDYEGSITWVIHSSDVEILAEVSYFDSTLTRRARRAWFDGEARSAELSAFQEGVRSDAVSTEPVRTADLEPGTAVILGHAIHTVREISAPHEGILGPRHSVYLDSHAYEPPREHDVDAPSDRTWTVISDQVPGVKIVRLTKDNIRALEDTLSPVQALRVRLTRTTATFLMSADEAIDLVRYRQSQAAHDHGASGHPYRSLLAVERKLEALAAEEKTAPTRDAGNSEPAEVATDDRHGPKALRELLILDGE